ncbi:hypothetical protein CC79DRAFT_1369677 [Sarocladium strictum]
MDLAHENNSELGLSGSTYELIEKEEGVPNTHHANTDSESQDDSQHEFDGSLSESIGSLDQNRQDDVQSLASTDHLEDEEDDGFHHHYEDEHDDASTAPDDEGSHLTDMTVVNNEYGPPAAHGINDVEELSDAESRSSIEYTRQSLGTPSVLTPEASKILNPMQDDANEVAEPTRPTGTARSVTEKALDTWDALKSKALDYIAVVMPPQPPSSDRKACITYQREHWIACEVRHAADVLGRNPKQIVVSTIMVLLASVMLGYADSLRSQSRYDASVSHVDTSTTTTTTTLIEASTLVQAVEPKQARSTSTAVALIPIHESHDEDWFFGYTMPDVRFTTEGENKVLIHVEPAIPTPWTAQRKCLNLHATRGDETIPILTSFIDKSTLMVVFTKAEAHGIVQIKLSSKCRPKLEKSVKVRFSNMGIMEQVFGCVGELAHVLAGHDSAHVQETELCESLKSFSANVDHTLESAKDIGRGLVSSRLDTASRLFAPLGSNVVKASQEAGRCLHRAEAALKTLSDRTEVPFRDLTHRGAQAVQGSWLTSSNMLGAVMDNVVHSAKSAAQKASASQQHHQANIKKAMSDISMTGVREELRFGVLDAQVAAKTWWLKLTGREDQSKEYGRRAKEFIAELHAYSAQDSRIKDRVKSWSAKGNCKSNGRGRGRGTHQCVPAA